jgi:serine/threonine protein kinase
LIGKGATASVYLAEDPFSGHEVAIKIAHQHVLNDPVHGARFKKMLMNEASLAGHLRHPHIVTVYDAGTEKGLHYIVMEHVRGETLKTHCSPGRLLPINEVLEIAFKCANALDYAYRRGMIHRDIKPANLLLPTGTDVKISDFGTALLADSDLTQIVDAVGTPSYMSPEQITGKELTQQTDIYSLGVVMYQLLCGKLPFKAENHYELIQKISKTSPTPLNHYRTDIPQGILEIIHRCLEKDPVNRYSDWPAFSKDLSKIHELLQPVEENVSDTYKFNILKSLSFFREFNDIELWEMLRISKWGRFPAETTLLQEGRIGGSLFILAKGQARIMKQDKFLGVIDAGQCFGEMAYISGEKKPRSASVVCNRKVTIIKIKNEALLKATSSLRSKFSAILLRTLAERLEKTSLMVSAL